MSERSSAQANTPTSANMQYGYTTSKSVVYAVSIVASLYLRSLRSDEYGHYAKPHWSLSVLCAESLPCLWYIWWPYPVGISGHIRRCSSWANAIPSSDVYTITTRPLAQSIRIPSATSYVFSLSSRFSAISLYGTTVGGCLWIRHVVESA